MKRLLLCLVLGRVHSQRDNANEIAHYSFQYQECAGATKFPDSVPSDQALETLLNARKLDRGAGSVCMGGHLGLNFTDQCHSSTGNNIDACAAATGCQFMPARTGVPTPLFTSADPGPRFAPGDVGPPVINGFGGDPTSPASNGFSIEMWLRPDPDVTQHRLVASLSAACPVIDPALESSCGTNEQDCYCEDGLKESGASPGSAIGFRVIQMINGCISLQFRVAPGTGPGAKKCVTLPPLAQNAYCPSTSASLLDLSGSEPQHVVITVKPDLDPYDGATDDDRFVVYINGAMATNNENGGLTLSRYTYNSLE
jgi:hypothetical protein